MAETKVDTRMITPDVSRVETRAAQSTSSGTAFDFSSIPSWAKRITVTVEQISLSGTDNFLIQLGDSGGIETTGYNSTSTTIGASNNTVSSTSGFVLRGASGSVIYSGGGLVLTLLNPSTNTWVASGFLGREDGTATVSAGGRKSLSGVLDRLRFTRSGSDTFDGGQVNILIEG